MSSIFAVAEKDPSYNPEFFKQTKKKEENDPNKGSKTNPAEFSNFINLNLLDKNAKIEGVKSNIRVRLPDKEDDEVSNEDMDDDIDVE